jgi:hypothetical protein
MNVIEFSRVISCVNVESTSTQLISCVDSTLIFVLPIIVVLVLLSFTETILHRDFMMKNVDSLQITVHSLAITNNGRNQHQNCVQSESHLTQAETKKMNLLHKLPVQCGTVYFVEYELLYPFHLISSRERRIIKEKDESKYSKNSRPWHSNVKRFCSRKKIGSGNLTSFPAGCVLERNFF